MEQLYFWLDQGIIWLFFFQFLSNNPYGVNIFVQILNRQVISFSPSLFSTSASQMPRTCLRSDASVFISFLHDLAWTVCNYIYAFMIWLAARAGKMNQILPIQPLAGKMVLPKLTWYSLSHLINLLLTMLVCSRWMDKYQEVSIIFFLLVYGPQLCLGDIYT